MTGEGFRFFYQFFIAGEFFYKGDELQNLLLVKYADRREKRFLLFWCSFSLLLGVGGGSRKVTFIPAVRGNVF
jgi:hypothetical protein